MNACSCLLDQAYLLLDLEEKAMEQEEEEQVVFFAEIRQQVLGEVWANRAASDPADLERHLGSILNRTAALTAHLQAWHGRMREGLQKTKAYNKFAAGSRYDSHKMAKQFYSLAQA